METKIIRAAVVQSPTTLFDTQGAMALVEKWAALAAASDVQLVVFPEAFIGGYPKGSTFGGFVGGRTDAGREEFFRYHRSAIEVPGSVTDQLGGVASEHDLHLVVGVIERDAGTLYCTVVFFAPDGSLLGKRRKLMPTGAERMVWGFGDGSTMDVYPTALGRLGAVICWENLMPAARMAMYDQGIELYCAPTADGRDSHHATMRHIAQEGRCFVLAANQVTRVADLPEDYEHPFGDDPQTIVSHGGSSIIGPLGHVLAGPVYDDEVLLIADLDMGDLARAKYDFDVIGHYSRPDIFQLIVNWEPQQPVNPRRAAYPGSPVQEASA